VGEGHDFKRRVLAEALSDRYGVALLEGDAVTAERVVRDAFDEGLPYALIHDAVIAPALHRIGKLWERGEIGVGHEHLATQISLRVLALLRELFLVTRRRSEQRVMLAAVQGEQHVVALQMAGDLLEDAGYEVVMLGPDVPTAVLADVVREHRPQVVGLSVTMPDAAAELTNAVLKVQEANPHAGIIIGAPTRPARLPDPPGVSFTSTVLDAVDLADVVVRRPQLN
jgi:MerR family transcriptional regulator, light-induced transcriptional regulator